MKKSNLVILGAMAVGMLVTTLAFGLSFSSIVLGALAAWAISYDYYYRFE